MAGGLFLAQAPKHAHLAIEKLGIEIAVEQGDAFGDIVERAAQDFQFVHVTNDVGYIRIGDDPAAVRQTSALNPHHLAVGEAHVDRGGVAFPDRANAIGDVTIDRIGFDLVGSRP